MENAYVLRQSVLYCVSPRPLVSPHIHKKKEKIFGDAADVTSHHVDLPPPPSQTFSSPGDTFTDGSVRYTMTSMNVPEPVMSLSITPKSKDGSGQVSAIMRCAANIECCSVISLSITSMSMDGPEEERARVKQMKV